MNRTVPGGGGLPGGSTGGIQQLRKQREKTPAWGIPRHVFQRGEKCGTLRRPSLGQPLHIPLLQKGPQKSQPLLHPGVLIKQRLDRPAKRDPVAAPFQKLFLTLGPLQTAQIAGELASHMPFPQILQKRRPVRHDQPARHQAGQALHRTAATVPQHQRPEQRQQRPLLQGDAALQGQRNAQASCLFLEQEQILRLGAEDGRLPKGDLTLQQVVKRKQHLVFLPVALDEAQTGSGRHWQPEAGGPWTWWGRPAPPQSQGGSAKTGAGPQGFLPSVS